MNFKWIVVLPLALVCAPGCFVFKDTCACDIQPEIAQPVKPSDEKPPEDKMPSYQREGVLIVNAPNMASEDAKADQDKLDANAEGRKAAHIK